MTHIQRTGHHRKPALALAAILMAAALAACSLAGISPEPPTATLGAVGETVEVAALHASSDTASSTPVIEMTEPPTETPIPADTATPEATLTPSITPNPTELLETLAAEEVLAQVQTQFAATETAASCGQPVCPTATSTRWKPPTRTPSPTPSVAYAYIGIGEPGPQSRVTSPIHLEARAHAGAGGKLKVELLGEDGRLLYREIVRYGSEEGRLVPLEMDIGFEISAVAEAGRLIVSIDDAQNRPISLASVDLILLSIGETEMTPHTDLQEPIAIRQPLMYQVPSGGTLVVNGVVRPLTSEPLIVELWANDGSLIGSRQVALPVQPGQGYAPFAVDVPYTLSKQTQVRLVIRQRDTRIESNVALSSVLFWLNP